MTDEEKFIINSFNNHLHTYRKEPLAIYGLGKNTKVILDNCCDKFNIVGLMDLVREGENVWGYDVLSMEDAAARGIKIIVIIATSVNVPVIFRRIERLCRKYGIGVFDINGNRICSEKRAYSCPKSYLENTEIKLKDEIMRHEVISFDVFDTLVVRRVLQPTDVFELIAKDEGHVYGEKKDGFYAARIKSERELYLNHANPNIYEIYEALCEKLEIDKGKLNELVEIEVAMEESVLSAREKMREIMEYARRNGKKICCTSDMYLTKEILKRLLEKCGFENFDEIFVSCDNKCSKTNGLYEKVVDYYQTKSILHIGDNEEADIKAAHKSGVDAFKISSVYAMIDDSSFSDVLENTDTLVDRCCLGGLFSRAFNNPFLFSRTQGKVEIKSEYELGRFYIAPVIILFFEWLIKKCEDDKISLLLLSARDGWLFKKILDLYTESNPVSFQYEYFYASRNACTIAGIRNREDLIYASKMAFDGDLEKMMKKRFFLTPEDILERKMGESDEDYLIRHEDKILKKAGQYRHFYEKYARQVSSYEGNIGFFDFVSSGTCQLWLEHILGKKLRGFYFVRNLDPYKKHLSIESFYKPAYVYEKQNKVYENYVFLETVLTSPQPSLHCISEDGFVFEEDTRSEAEKSGIQSIHRGILDFYSDVRREELPGLKLAEYLLEICSSDKYAERQCDYLDGLVLIDEFCNRKFVV